MWKGGNPLFRLQYKFWTTAKKYTCPSLIQILTPRNNVVEDTVAAAEQRQGDQKLKWDYRTALVLTGYFSLRIKILTFNSLCCILLRKFRQWWNTFSKKNIYIKHNYNIKQLQALNRIQRGSNSPVLGEGHQPYLGKIKRGNVLPPHNCSITVKKRLAALIT